MLRRHTDTQLCEGNRREEIMMQATTRDCMMDVVGFVIKPLRGYILCHTGNQFQMLLPARGMMTVTVNQTTVGCGKLQQPVTFK